MQRRRAAAVRRRVAESATAYERLPPEQIIKRIKKLEQEMFKHARNLEFEEAARLRDEIERLRKAELGLPATPRGLKDRNLNRLACFTGVASSIFGAPFQARSSVVEHHLDMVVVGGSIPLAPTRFFEGRSLRPFSLSALLSSPFQCP